MNKECNNLHCLFSHMAGLQPERYQGKNTRSKLLEETVLQKCTKVSYIDEDEIEDLSRGEAGKKRYALCSDN